MFFEIYRDGNLIARGDRLLAPFRIHNELMYVPSTKIRLPIIYREFLSGREEFKLYFGDKCFHALVMEVEVNKERDYIDIQLEHVLAEWEYRQISVNNAVKDGRINVIYKGKQTATNGNVSVTANPFTVLLSELGRFRSAQYVQRANATAWTSDGEKLPITANYSAVQEKSGTYDVIFTAGGASVTVPATVKENPNKRKSNGYVLSASNFSATDDEVKTMTDADYIRKANATVTPSGTISVDHDNVKPESGTYSVKYSTTYTYKGQEKTISITAYVVVSGENSTNATVADNLADIYADTNFAYKGWELIFSDKAKNEVIDYVYSRQSKLKALNKTVELTPDIYYRVGMVEGRILEISEFGERKQMRISAYPSGVNNTRIVKEPTIKHEFSHVINMASVYSSKSDGGMNSVTLRDVYTNPDLWVEGFPIVILRSGVNNERDYSYYSDIPEIAPNKQYEYAILDEESIALEAGNLIEGTYAFDDLAPFNIDPNEKRQVENKDRIMVARKCYHAGVRLLKQARRRFKHELTTEELPYWINVGDQILYDYDNDIYIIGECTSYQQKVLSEHSWFYITSIDYNVQETGAVLCDVTLEKYLHTERKIKYE